MISGLHVFNRVKSILMQEVDWTSGYTQDNNKKLQKYKNTIKKYQEFIKKNFEYVGENFSKKVRSIH